jgi:uncharacterized ferritin-like protein (DUF455 family)
MPELRQATLGPLLIADAPAKAAATLALSERMPVDPHAIIGAPPGIPGRPARPRMVGHIQLKPPSLRSPAGIAALVHSIAHIELNAIDLALDICWRFAGMPEAFYRDWLRIAQEEAKHFTLLREHLLSLGFDYGDFDAHNALWDMAERTQHDLLARIALVPRTLEARGLDASPAVKRKLVGAGDHRAGAILDIILSEEIGHVAAGNRWYRHVCAERGLDPISTYAELAARYQAPKLRAPFNMEARRAAGFDEAELAALTDVLPS